MLCEGVSHFLHYLDDFFFCPPQQPGRCQPSLRVAVSLCEYLGFPVAPEKVVGPATTLVFLGIELDSDKMEMRLPQEKLERLQGSIDWWLTRESVTKKQLQSIVGQLSDAAVVVRPGRTFLRSLIETSKVPKKQNHLNQECQADLQWWASFIQSWNGISLFPGRPLLETVTSDASGSWGCGALVEGGSLWFQFQWPASRSILPQRNCSRLSWPRPYGGPDGGVSGSCSEQTIRRWCQPWPVTQPRTRPLFTCSGPYSLLRPILTSNIPWCMSQGKVMGQQMPFQGIRWSHSSLFSHRPLPTQPPSLSR